MHGRPTEKPGSWLNGSVTCGNATCENGAVAITQDNNLECDNCKEERKRRKLVVTDAEDERLKEKYSSMRQLFSQIMTSNMIQIKSAQFPGVVGIINQ